MTPGIRRTLLTTRRLLSRSHPSTRPMGSTAPTSPWPDSPPLTARCRLACPTTKQSAWVFATIEALLRAPVSWRGCGCVRTSRPRKMDVDVGAWVRTSRTRSQGGKRLDVAASDALRHLKQLREPPRCAHTHAHQHAHVAEVAASSKHRGVHSLTHTLTRFQRSARGFFSQHGSQIQRQEDK